MKNSKNTKRLPKTRIGKMSGMVSINPTGYWSLGELCCDEISKSFK